MFLHRGMLLNIKISGWRRGRLGFGVPRGRRHGAVPSERAIIRDYLEVTANRDRLSG